METYRIIFQGFEHNIFKNIQVVNFLRVLNVDFNRLLGIFWENLRYSFYKFLKDVKFFESVFQELKRGQF